MRRTRLPALWSKYFLSTIHQIILSGLVSVKQVVSEKSRQIEIDVTEISLKLKSLTGCEFRNSRRKREESVADYGYALKRLAIRAFPSITPLNLWETGIIRKSLTNFITYCCTPRLSGIRTHNISGDRH
jgi:hypothetical protein